MLDISSGPNNALIQFPVLKVSGQNKPFDEKVEVVLGYSGADVADLDAKFFPVGKKFLFTSKYGVLLSSHKNSEGNETWENVQGDETKNGTAVIKRTEGHRLEISFSVYHFCKVRVAVKKSEDVSTEGVEFTDESHQEEASPGLTAICVAAHETDSRFGPTLFAVVAPYHKRNEVKTEWGLQGETFNERLKDYDEIFFCVPQNDSHLNIPDNNIRFFKDVIKSQYNRVDCDESVACGLDMRFLRKECVDNMHSRSNFLGKCAITPKPKNIDKSTRTDKSAVDELPVASPGTSESYSTTSYSDTSNSGHFTSSNDASNDADQLTKNLEMMKGRCEFFQKEIERFFKKRLKLDGEKKESKASKFVRVGGPATTILISIGSGLAIVMGVTTLGIGAAFAGAAVAAATFTVQIRESRKNTKLATPATLTEQITESLKNAELARNVEELYEVDPDSLILTILKKVGIELSRIFEEQLFNLEDYKDVTEMACCAVNLIFKFKGGEKFNRDALVRNVLLGKANKKNLKTKRNNKRWQVPDVFQKPGLRKEIPKSVSSSVEFQYLSKCNDTCDPQTYGYRGEILEMFCKTTNNESEAQNIDYTEPNGGGYGTTSSCCSVDTAGARGEVTYFIECNIDKEYTKTCAEASCYQPFHCLVRCPSMLESFASNGSNSSPPSLKDFVSKMYHSKVKPVRPVYRPHSPRILRSLSDTDLSGSDFSGVNFSSSSLENCNLNGCTILFGELKDASLCRSQFKETRLSYCNLTGIKAQWCDWTAAKVLYSCVDNADLRGGVNIGGGDNWKGTSLKKAYTTGDLPSSRVTNQPEHAVLPGINPGQEQRNGIAPVSPMLHTSYANNHVLPRPIEDTFQDGQKETRV